MLMKDKAATRLAPKAITSYSTDKEFNYSMSIAWPIIRLTIGSAVLVLHYDKTEDRDSDIFSLDQWTELKS